MYTYMNFASQTQRPRPFERQNPIQTPIVSSFVLKSSVIYYRKHQNSLRQSSVSTTNRIPSFISILVCHVSFVRYWYHHSLIFAKWTLNSRQSKPSRLGHSLASFPSQWARSCGLDSIHLCIIRRNSFLHQPLSVYSLA
jgi:hypothetical protein